MDSSCSITSTTAALVSNHVVSEWKIGTGRAPPVRTAVSGGVARRSETASRTSATRAYPGAPPPWREYRCSALVSPPPPKLPALRRSPSQTSVFRLATDRAAPRVAAALAATSDLGDAGRGPQSECLKAMRRGPLALRGARRASRCAHNSSSRLVRQLDRRTDPLRSPTDRLP